MSEVKIRAASKCPACSAPWSSAALIDPSLDKAMYCKCQTLIERPSLPNLLIEQWSKKLLGQIESQNEHIQKEAADRQNELAALQERITVAEVKKQTRNRVRQSMEQLREKMRGAGFDHGPVLSTPALPSTSGAVAQSLRWSGNFLVNAGDGQELAQVPAGKFFMGNTRWENSSPVREIHLDDYAIGRYPVTNAQYALFIRAGGYKDRQYWSDEGWKMCTEEEWTQPEYWDDKTLNQRQQPVVGVSWYEAEAYCNWAGLRLPTEAQWQKAARGGVFLDGDAGGKIENPLPQRTYPWGEQAPNTDGIWRANYYATPIYGDKSTSPVGYFPYGRSPCGCLDMAGNVWEWCHDWYDRRYYQSMPDRNPSGPEGGQSRVLLGGSWLRDVEWDLGMAGRYGVRPGVRNPLVGLRASGPLGT